jgi:dipeptidyl aminopeptidase/acylaminoacyl peptidase
VIARDIVPSTHRPIDGSRQRVAFRGAHVTSVRSPGVLQGQAEATRLARLSLLMAVSTFVLLCIATRALGTAAQAPKPVTVEDSIGMTSLDNPDYGLGMWRRDDVAAIAPDGKHFVVIAKTGNLERNTVDYRLLLFDTRTARRTSPPAILATLASSSARPGIESVTWLDESTVAFLGEHPGELHQVFSVDLESKHLRRWTNESTDVGSYAFSSDRRELVFSRARNPSVNRDEQSTVVAAGESLPHVLGLETDTLFFGQDVLLIREGESSPSLVKTRGRVEGSPLWLSPDGRSLVVRVFFERSAVPETWFDYAVISEGSVLTRSGVSIVEQYELLDLTHGTSQPLIDAPVAAWYSNVHWSADGRSVIVSGTNLSLDVRDLRERERRRTNVFVAEVSVPTGKTTPITQDDANIRSWDSRSNVLVLQLTDHKVYSTFAEHGLASFRKGVRGWEKEGGAAPQQHRNSGLRVAVEEDMNTPPRLIATDARTGRKSLLFDPNPQFLELQFARVQEISVKTTSGGHILAGLYLPPHCTAAIRCPLVIQTHGWTRDRFWIDGPDTTAMAAQALAARGMVVVQVGDEIAAEINSRYEGRVATEMFEAIVNDLDAKHLIDSKRLGIAAFSYTGPAVEYAIAHSKYRFEAAVAADSSNLGYFSYVAFHDTAFNIWTNRGEASYGGPPFGRSFGSWVEEAPNFNLQSVSTAMRFEANSRLSVLAYWEWYVAFRKLGKPVELIVTPEAGHVSTRPRDRLVSQGGTVDWFDFWLNHHEDPTPAKAEQYQRWRELRKLRDAQQPTPALSSVR